MKRKDISLKVGDEVVFNYGLVATIEVLTETNYQCSDENGYDVCGGLTKDLNWQVTAINGEPVEEDTTLLDEMAKFLKEICGDLWEKEHKVASSLLARYSAGER